MEFSEAEVEVEVEAQDEGIDEGDTESVDPQHWIDQLTAGLEDAEARLGEDHRDSLRARIDLASAYRQIGEHGLAVPLAVRNTLQAEQLFPPNGSLAASLRAFQDEACALAGYTAGDVRLLTGADAEPEPEPEPEPSAPEAAAVPESAAEAEPEWRPEPEYVSEYAPEYAPESESESPTASDPVLESDSDPEPAPAWQADPDPVPVQDLDVEVLVIENAAVTHASAEQSLYIEVISLRYELQEAQRTIARLRHRNAKLIEALDDEKTAG